MSVAPSSDPVASSSSSAAAEQLVDAIRRSSLSDIHSLHALHSSLPHARDSSGHTALHWAAMNESLAILQAILDYTSHPIDVQSLAQPQLGQSPLQWAVVAGNIRNVALLLQRGANASHKDSCGLCPATHAAMYERVDILHVLLLAAPETRLDVDVHLHSPLHWAAHTGRYGVVRYLLCVMNTPHSPRDTSGQTPLHMAAASGHVMVCDALLRAGANARDEDESGRNALQMCAHFAARKLLQEWIDGRRGVEKPVPRRINLRSHALVLFYYVMLVLSYIVYVQYIRLYAGMGLGSHLALHLFCIAAFVTHSMATYCDPGEIEMGSAREFEIYITRAIANRISERALGAQTYCFSCFTKRLPRSRHSRVRDRCIRRFDHECPWINNTVGLRNHRCLLIFAFTLGVTELLLVHSLWTALRFDGALKSAWDALLHRPLQVALLIVHTPLAVFCVVLLLKHASLIAKGLTTYEEIAYAKMKQTTNPYDRGLKRNCLDFLASSGPGTERESVSALPKKDAQLMDVHAHAPETHREDAREGTTSGEVRTRLLAAERSS